MYFVPHRKQFGKKTKLFVCHKQVTGVVIICPLYSPLWTTQDFIILCTRVQYPIDRPVRLDTASWSRRALSSPISLASSGVKNVVTLWTGLGLDLHKKACRLISTILHSSKKKTVSTEAQQYHINFKRFPKEAIRHIRWRRLRSQVTTMEVFCPLVLLLSRGC